MFNRISTAKYLSKAYVRRFASETGGSVQATALYDFHVKNGGKLVNFGGYSLPVQYADQSIVASHLHTRKYASIFDVSHMLQTYIRGKDAIATFEPLCTADIRGAADGVGSLTVFTNSTGGILDDLIVTRVNENLLYVVSNAAMKAQDMQIMQEAVSKSKSNGKDVHIEFLASTDQSLIAVQGPTAVNALRKLLPSNIQIDKLYFMNTTATEIAGIPNCRVTRCGYTGEDGFEISVASDRVEQLTQSLLEVSPADQIKLAGLGARDSLRLEAGLCLYGNDIDTKTTPIEAGLAWLVAKRRRSELNFPGASHICEQLKPGNVTRRRVGFEMLTTSTPPPARAGVTIHHNETEVGSITSGCPSPSLGKNVAMGYIAEKLKAPDTLVQFKIRGKFYDAKVVRMPFVKTNYYLKPK